MTNDNKKKGRSENNTKSITSLKVNCSQKWNEAGITITINVKVLADRIENGKNLPIRFFKPCNDATLTNKSSGARGKTSWSFKIPMNQIQNILSNQNGKIKIGVEIISKKGEAGKEIKKLLTEEIEINITLPAGTIKKGWWSFLIRKEKHLADFFLACIIIFLSFIFLKYAGKGNVNIFTGVAMSGIILLWWKKTKSTLRTILGALLLILVFCVIKTNPDAFSEPIFKGIYMSLLVGAPFYILEELWRKSDGTSKKNFYPLWPVGICLISMLVLILDIFGGLIPKTITGFNPFSLNDFLNTNHPWSFLNSVPFMANIKFHDIAWNLSKITELLVTSLILLIYGGSRELYDWFKSLKSGGATNVSPGGMAGIFVVISELWGAFKDIILPLLGRRGRRK